MLNLTVEKMKLADHTDFQEYKKEGTCVICQANQASNDKMCPKWKEEKEIQRIKAERGILYTEANKRMDIFNYVKSTYAQTSTVIKPAKKTFIVETQMEMTWPEGIREPKSVQLRNRKRLKSASTQTCSS